MQPFEISNLWNAVLKAGLACDKCLGSIEARREQEARLWGTHEDTLAVEHALDTYGRAIADALKQLMPILRPDAESYYEASNLLQRLYENRREDAVRRCRVVPRIESYRDLRRAMLDGIAVGESRICAGTPLGARRGLVFVGGNSEGLALAAIWGRLGLDRAARDPITAVRIERLDQQLREARKTKGSAE